MTSPLHLDNPAQRRFHRLSSALRWAVILVAAAAPPAAEAVTPGATVASAVDPAPDRGGPVAKILTTAAGAYQVRYEDLAPAIATAGPWPSARLGLTNRGSAVPIWVDDGGDGVFGEGDSFEFVAEILPGTHGAYHEHASANVYLLSPSTTDPARMTPVTGRRTAAPGEDVRQDYAGTLHMEVDTLLMRFGCRRESEHEIWYWQKLASVDETAFTHEFELPGLAVGRGTARLEVDLHGWSALHRAMTPRVPDHSLQIFLNDVLVRQADFDGKAVERITLTDLDPGLLRQGKNTLRLSVPPRRDAEDNLIPDAVVLNWIDLRYPRSAEVVTGQQGRFRLPPGVAGRTAALRSAEALGVYAADGSRFALGGARDGDWIEIPARRSIVVAPAGTLLRPHRVLPFAGGLRAVGREQVDYIAIVHPDLRDAIEPLLEYRRGQGLRVQVALVDEVYDAFNHGIPDPQALRAFLRQAYESWPRPAPRFVLLVGDASWDSKHEDPKLEHYAFKTEPLLNDGVGRAEGTHYAGLTANNRGLIPTWNYLTHSGHAASDNGFVSFDGDSVPELAVGRFPAVNAEEVRDMVQKTIAHETASDDAWRRNTLWITNEQPGFQQSSDRLAVAFTERGYVAHKIYPRPGEAGSSQRIVDAFDEGQSLVYFYGHGGRFIWRTSPLDLSENQDLFSLDDLDRLRPTVKTPVVMSFTCYSAPFDHPSEDSIGEKLIRLGGRGAVAVIAASWRNAPSLTMQADYLAALAESETVGEALVEAKRRVRTPELTQTYNLLGDPALRLHFGARPAPGAAGQSGSFSIY